MPKQVKARAAHDPQEERQVRKLAGSHHAPADWKFHAQMVIESWAGKTPNEIAAELKCHPQTVRIHLKRFNAEGIAGLGMRPGSGRKPRLTELERSRSSRWPGKSHQGTLRRALMGRWWPETKRVQPNGVSMLWPRPLKRLASRSNAVRSDVFICVKACAGVTRIVGVPVMIQTSSQKNRGRQPLHRATRGVDDHLHRRTRTGSAAYLRSGCWLACYGAPHQSAAGLRARAREDLGLRGAAGV